MLLKQPELLARCWLVALLVATARRLLRLLECGRHASSEPSWRELVTTVVWNENPPMQPSTAAADVYGKTPKSMSKTLISSNSQPLV